MNVCVFFRQLLTHKMHLSWEIISRYSLLSLSVFVTISLPLPLKKKNQAMDLKNNNKGIRNKSSCGVPVVAETSWAMLQPLWGPKKWEVRGGTKHYSAKCTLLEWADSYSFLTDQINLVAITSVKWNQRKKNVFSQVIIMQCDKALDCRRKREFWKPMTCPGMEGTSQNLGDRVAVTDLDFIWSHLKSTLVFL